MQSNIGTQGSTSGSTTDQVLDQARQTADAIKHEASDLAAQATDSAKSFAEQNKGKAAQQVSTFASALYKAADELDGSEQAGIAKYARDMAGGLESVSRSLNEKGVDELMSTVQNFARTQPVAFYGLAALAGFAASRFLVASAERPRQQSMGGMSTSTSRYGSVYGEENLGTETADYPDSGTGSDDSWRSSTSSTFDSDRGM